MFKRSAEPEVSKQKCAKTSKMRGGRRQAQNRPKTRCGVFVATKIGPENVFWDPYPYRLPPCAGAWRGYLPLAFFLTAARSAPSKSAKKS